MHNTLRLYSRNQHIVLKLYILLAKLTPIPLIGRLVRWVANTYGQSGHQGYLLSLEQAEQIIDASDDVALVPCSCRQVFHNCDGPLMTEIIVGAGVAAFSRLKSIEFRSISKAGAKEIMQQCHQKQMLHTLVKCGEHFYAICNCCTCCCVPFRLKRDHGIQYALVKNENIVDDFRKQQLLPIGQPAVIKAMLFDLDGTILDSLSALWRAFDAGVVASKLEPISKKALMALMSRGLGLADILREAFPQLRTEAASSSVEKIISEIRKDYLARVEDEVQLVSGAQSLLSSLKSRGLKIGIVTSRNMAPERLWRELERLQVAQLMDVVVTGAEAKRKPAPDMVIEALRRLQLLPKEAIFVGDSEVDVIAGKKAGVTTAVIAAGVANPQVLLVESPDFVFDTLFEFTDNLDFILNRR